MINMNGVCCQQWAMKQAKVKACWRVTDCSHIGFRRNVKNFEVNWVSVFGALHTIAIGDGLDPLQSHRGQLVLNRETK